MLRPPRGTRHTELLTVRLSLPLRVRLQHGPLVRTLGHLGQLDILLVGLQVTLLARLQQQVIVQPLVQQPHGLRRTVQTLRLVLTRLLQHNGRLTTQVVHRVQLTSQLRLLGIQTTQPVVLRILAPLLLQRLLLRLVLQLAWLLAVTQLLHTRHLARPQALVM